MGSEDQWGGNPEVLEEEGNIISPREAPEKKGHGGTRMGQPIVFGRTSVEGAEFGPARFAAS